MTTDETTTATPAGIRERLALLQRERAAAELNGLADNGLYMRHLLADLEATRHAYVGAAVTEIASLRSALGGPLLG